MPNYNPKPRLGSESIDVVLLFLITNLYDNTERTKLHDRIQACLLGDPNNPLVLFITQVIENKIKKMNVLMDCTANYLINIPIDVIKIIISYVANPFDEGILLEPADNVLGFNYAFYIYLDTWTGYIKVIVRTEHIGLTHTEWFKHFSYCNEYYYESLQSVRYNYNYEMIDMDTIAELERKIPNSPN